MFSLITYLVIFALTTGDYYFRHSRYFYDIADDHQFNPHDGGADVLLVGDSSLLFGVMPRKITEQTGLSIYSEAVSGPVFAVFPDAVAALTDRYLAHNRRPKLIVLYLAPATRAHPPFAAFTQWYDGEIMLMRHGSPLQIASYFASHPERVTPFVTMAGHFARNMDPGANLHGLVESKLDDSRGFFDESLIAERQSVLDSTHCARPSLLPPLVPDKELLEGFRKMAAQRGIPAAVYLAPFPECDQVFASKAPGFSKLIDNVPYTLPNGRFLNDGSFAHLNPAGASDNSRDVAVFLRDAMHKLTPSGATP